VSNPFAIAAVTATFSQLLTRAASEPTLTGTDVSNLPPDAARDPDNPIRQLNLFLYQVTPDPAWRNADLPFRDGGGAFTRQPVLALNLTYLLTAYGLADDELDAHHLLGHAMSLVHDQSVLTREQVRAAIQAFSGNPAVAGSDLADQVELVKLTPVPMTQEELFKLWSAFQTNYRLSVGYEASVVLIERPRQHKAALPVRRAGVYVMPFRQPRIEQLTPNAVPAGATLTIEGRNLRGDIVKVRFGDAAVDPDTVGESSVAVTVPASVQAGVNPVQVLHELPLGEPPSPHRGFESNVGAFVLTPRVTLPTPASVAHGGKLTLGLAPPVGQAQRVSLLVGEQELVLPRRPAGSTPASSLDFPIPTTFPSGTYLLRVRVDGAESPLEVDPVTNTYSGPKVEVT
jgi:hypothetical protein